MGLKTQIVHFFALYGLICFLLLPWVILQSIEEIVEKFQQNDYKMNFEWGEVISYNKHYLKKFHAVAFKYNRTCTVANITIEYNVDIGNDLELIVQAYKFASNEYRFFPARFQINFCFGLSKNMIGGQRAYTCGNFSGCPIQKGRRYHICNWAPDEAHFPPFIPNGRYKLEIQGLYKETEMFLLQTYGSIDRPIVKK